MNKKFILGILLVGIIVLIASFFVFNRTNISPPTDEEYNVYSALINSEYTSDRIKLIVIEENTTKSITPGTERQFDKTYIKQHISELQQVTIDNFKKANQQSYLLKRQFNLSVNYILISQDEINNIFKEGNKWEDFYKKYPNSQGRMTLSRVGFNRQKDQALVYMGNQRNSEAGRGGIFLLVKENNIWKIKLQITAWVS